MVIVHVRHGIYATIMPLDLRFCAHFALRRRALGDATVIRAQTFMALFRTPRENRHCDQQSKCKGCCKTELH